MIEFSCPSCSASLKSPSKFSGRRVKCNACGEVSRVPGGVPHELASLPPVSIGGPRDRHASRLGQEKIDIAAARVKRYIAAGRLSKENAILALRMLKNARKQGKGYSIGQILRAKNLLTEAAPAVASMPIAGPATAPPSLKPRRERIVEAEEPDFDLPEAELDLEFAETQKRESRIHSLSARISTQGFRTESSRSQCKRRNSKAVKLVVAVSSIAIICVACFQFAGSYVFQYGSTILQETFGEKQRLVPTGYYVAESLQSSSGIFGGTFSPKEEGKIFLVVVAELPADWLRPSEAEFKVMQSEQGAKESIELLSPDQVTEYTPADFSIVLADGRGYPGELIGERKDVYNVGNLHAGAFSTGIRIVTRSMRELTGTNGYVPPKAPTTLEVAVGWLFDEDQVQWPLKLSFGDGVPQLVPRTKLK